MVVTSHQDSNAKIISILGVTGTVGQLTKEIIVSSTQAFRVHTVSARQNVKGLAEAAIVLKAQCAVILETTHLEQLKTYLEGTSIKALSGHDALIDQSSQKVDWIISAITGSAALVSTMAAITSGSTVALANKECLVCAGALMKRAAQASGATLIPVDSEHNAIFQLLNEGHKSELLHVTLTASGGPFLDYDSSALKKVTIKEALNHPNWTMGDKITIDSATMVNKGLEIIEAHHLFDLGPDRIKVVVHPQSIIHALVQFNDGSVLAQMGYPTMKTPIAYALSWPDRMETDCKPLDLITLSRLEFRDINSLLRPAIDMAYQALSEGSDKQMIYNTANEVAVSAFLEGKIGFMDITATIDTMLQSLVIPQANSIEEASDFIGQIVIKTEEYLSIPKKIARN